ncbi:MAG: hypothetical protein SGPRY_001311 [Prymnesium sp.]
MSDPGTEHRALLIRMFHALKQLYGRVEAQGLIELGVEVIEALSMCRSDFVQLVERLKASALAPPPSPNSPLAGRAAVDEWMHENGDTSKGGEACSQPSSPMARLSSPEANSRMLDQLSTLDMEQLQEAAHYFSLAEPFGGLLPRRMHETRYLGQAAADGREGAAQRFLVTLEAMTRQAGGFSPRRLSEAERGEQQVDRGERGLSSGRRRRLWLEDDSLMEQESMGSAGGKTPSLTAGSPPLTAVAGESEGHAGSEACLEDKFSLNLLSNDAPSITPRLVGDEGTFPPTAGEMGDAPPTVVEERVTTTRAEKAETPAVPASDHATSANEWNGCPVEESSLGGEEGGGLGCEIAFMMTEDASRRHSNAPLPAWTSWGDEQAGGERVERDGAGVRRRKKKAPLPSFLPSSLASPPKHSVAQQAAEGEGEALAPFRPQEGRIVDSGDANHADMGPSLLPTGGITAECEVSSVGVEVVRKEGLADERESLPHQDGVGERQGKGKEGWELTKEQEWGADAEEEEVEGFEEAGDGKDAAPSAIGADGSRRVPAGTCVLDESACLWSSRSFASVVRGAGAPASPSSPMRLTASEEGGGLSEGGGRREKLLSPERKTAAELLEITRKRHARAEATREMLAAEEASRIEKKRSREAQVRERNHRHYLQKKKALDERMMRAEAAREASVTSKASRARLENQKASLAFCRLPPFPFHPHHRSVPLPLHPHERRPSYTPTCTSCCNWCFVMLQVEEIAFINSINELHNAMPKEQRKDAITQRMEDAAARRGLLHERMVSANAARESAAIERHRLLLEQQHARLRTSESRADVAYLRWTEATRSESQRTAERKARHRSQVLERRQEQQRAAILEVESKKAALQQRMAEANERRLAHVELLLQQARIASERQAAVQQARGAKRMSWAGEGEKAESSETDHGGEPSARRRVARSARRKHPVGRVSKGVDGCSASGDENRSESSRSERSMVATVNTAEGEAGEPSSEQEQGARGEGPSPHYTQEVYEENLPASPKVAKGEERKGSTSPKVGKRVERGGEMSPKLGRGEARKGFPSPQMVKGEERRVGEQAIVLPPTMAALAEVEPPPEGVECRRVSPLRDLQQRAQAAEAAQQEARREQLRRLRARAKKVLRLGEVRHRMAAVAAGVRVSQLEQLWASSSFLPSSGGSAHSGKRVLRLLHALGGVASQPQSDGAEVAVVELCRLLECARERELHTLRTHGGVEHLLSLAMAGVAVEGGGGGPRRSTQTVALRALLAACALPCNRAYLLLRNHADKLAFQALLLQYIALLHALLLPVRLDPSCSCSLPLRSFLEDSGLAGVPGLLCAILYEANQPTAPPTSSNSTLGAMEWGGGGSRPCVGLSAALLRLCRSAVHLLIHIGSVSFGQQEDANPSLGKPSFLARVLGCGDLKIQTFHLAHLALQLCGQADQLALPPASTAEEERPHTSLTHEVVMLLGLFCLRSRPNCEVLRWRWGHHQMMLHRLCSLPFSYFVHPSLRDVLFPTLICGCLGDTINLRILAAKLSPAHIHIYLGETHRDSA